MRGRMMHSPAGELTFQRYGRDDSQYINSISRGDLNKTLITAAENTGNVKVEFNHPIEDPRTLDEPIVFGADGSGSAARRALSANPEFNNVETNLDHGYKELAIAPGPGGTHRLERNALHIWPRGTYMLIALPNFDGSFTCTLFLPFKGPVSFDALKTGIEVSAFFSEHFSDALPLIETLENAFFTNPTGQPPSCSIYSNSNQPIIFKHVGTMKGTIYAPFARVEMKNIVLPSITPVAYGLIWAKTVDMIVDFGGGKFYYDLALRDKFLSTDVALVSWKDIRN